MLVGKGGCVSAGRQVCVRRMERRELFILITKVFSFVNCVLRFSYGRLFLCPKGVLHFGDATYYLHRYDGGEL